MKFYEVQPALEEGKKIRRQSNPDVIIYMGKINTFDGTRIPSLMREKDGDPSHSDIYGRIELFADDWEIVEDIQEVELFMPKKVRYTCPKCKRESEQLIYPEDKPETVHECRHCGQKYRFKNIDEMKDMLYNNHETKSFEDILKDYGIFDLWKSETQKILESDDVWVSWTNYTKEEAKKAVDQTVKAYNELKKEEKSFEDKLKERGINYITSTYARDPGLKYRRLDFDESNDFFWYTPALILKR